MNSGLRPRPLSALWGEERKKGPQVKICLLRFCEDLFVCLFSFVGTGVLPSFQYAASEKEKESAIWSYRLLCSATMSKDCTIVIYLWNNSFLLHANAMISTPSVNTIRLFDMFPHLKLTIAVFWRPSIRGLGNIEPPVF